MKKWCALTSVLLFVVGQVWSQTTISGKVVSVESGNPVDGANIRVEHSTCGALAACENYTTGPMALMMEYCIAGHHSGIPDGGFANDSSDMPTLQGRMKRQFEDYSEYKSELFLPELIVFLFNRKFLSY